MATNTQTIQLPTATGSVIAIPASKGQPPPSDTKLRKVQKVPVFTDKYEQRKWEKSQMAGAFRVFAKLGYADGVAGHMSLRDPVNPDLFWINPYAKHFSRINVSDLVLVDEHGEIQQEATANDYTVSKAGFIIHSALHQMRPDINVAVHLHSPHGRAWSAFGKPIEMLVQDSCYFYNDLSVYEGFGGTVLAREEGENLARALGPTNKNLILQNHGIMSCGSNVGEAAGFFIALERACQTQLLIEAAAATGGVAKKYIPQAEVEYSKKYDYTPENTYMSFQPEYQCMLDETEGAFLK